MALAFPPSCPHMAGIFYAVGAARQEVDLVVPAERIELPTFGLQIPWSIFSEGNQA